MPGPPKAEELRKQLKVPPSTNIIRIDFLVKDDVDGELRLLDCDACDVSYNIAVFVLGELSGSLKNVLAFVKPLLSVALEHKVELLTVAAGARVMRISLHFGHFDHRSVPYLRHSLCEFSSYSSITNFINPLIWLMAARHCMRCWRMCA